MNKSSLKSVLKKVKKRGFTLIEMIAVIVIIAILVSITVPAVREFISGGRKVAYKSYIKNMEVAAQGYITDCVQNNEKTCGLPDIGESTVISLSDLIEMGFSDKLKDPEVEGYCEESTSYVTISNKGDSIADIDYEACLYCSNYQPDSPTCIRYTGEGSEPVCGTVNGSSSTWTNASRTISVGCNRADSEASSECSKSEFSKTFITSTDVGKIRISSVGGKTTDCDVEVKVDKDKPTCALKVKEGSVQQNGWYGENTIVQLYDQNDTGGSGVLTYGVGSSLSTPNYNKDTEITVGSGITTVFGYVMDKAGNEGNSSMQIMADTTKPVVSKVLQGYQVYPDKEEYTANGLTINGNIHTTTNNDPQIDINGLAKYKQVSRVVVWFTTPLTSGMNTQVFYGKIGYGYSEANSVSRTIGSGESSVSFEIPKDTYDGIRVDLGSASGLTYSISRIEVIAEDTSGLYTNKDVRLYVYGTDTITGVSSYSFDNGASWVNDTNKLYSTNQNVTVKLVDGAGNVSDPYVVSIDNIDKIAPSCTLALGGSSTNGWYTSNVSVTFGSTLDGAGTSQYAMSGTKRYGIGSLTGSSSVTHTADTNSSGVTYTGYIEDNAGNTASCTTSLKKDATSPTITFSPNGNATLLVSHSTSVTHSDGTGSGVATSQYAWSTSNSVEPTFTNTYTNGQSLTVTTMNSANYYLWIKTVDTVGNTRIATSNAFNVSAPRYTVAFNINGGTGGTTASKSCTYNQSCVLTANGFTKTGYSFAGWATTAGGAVAYTDAQSVTNLSSTDGATVTLYAKWTPITYTVAFNINTGTSGSTASKVCTYDAACTLTANGFSKTNFAFDKWNTLANGTGTSYNNSANVTNLSSTNGSTVTLYAQWIDLSYVVMYDVNGGTGVVNSHVCYQGTPCTITSTEPSKTGYIFTGWNTASNGSGTAYTKSQQVVSPELGTAGSVILLYAQYPTPITYTIAFNANGGTGTTANKVCTYDQACVLTTNGFSRTGYAYNGWNTVANGSGTSYANNASVTNLTATNGSTINMYAQWTANTYTVAFNANGGTGTTASKACTYDVACTLTTNGFSRTGYTFAGWATTAGGAVAYTNGASVTNLTSTNGATVTLYAKWTANTYTVAFNINTGTGGTTASVVCTYDVACTLTANGFTKTNFAFDKWNTLANGTGTSYNNSASVTNLTSTNGATITLYAQWIDLSYVVMYDVNGGTGVVNSHVCYQGTPCTITSTEPSKTGYIFTGWNTASNGSGTAYTKSQQVVSPELGTAGSVILLYAQYPTPITYTVAFNANGGTGTVSSIGCTYDAACTLPSNTFTRTGYIAASGWATSAGGAVAYANGASVTNLASTQGATATLYAGPWTAITYTMVFNANGGTGTTASKVCTYDVACTLTTNGFSRTGYVFAGWAPNPGDAVMFTNGQTVTNLFSTNGVIVTLYAKWTPITYTIAFNSNGGTGTVASKVCTYDVACTLPTNTFTMPGYASNGWNSAANGSGTSYANGQSVTNLSSTNGATVTLYASPWIDLSYVVMYDVNGGTGVVNSQVCYQGSPCTITSTVPTKTGYLFTTWNRASNGSGASYASSQVVSPDLGMAGDVVLLYAQYPTPITYTVRFNINTGTGGTTANKVCTYNLACTLTANGFYKTNFGFGSWNTLANGSGTSYADQASVMNLANTNGAIVDLYAQWVDLSYVVTYDVNGGTGVVNSHVCYFGSNCTISATQPSKTGYTFTGWNTAINGSGSAYTTSQIVSPNLGTAGSVILLYAQYTPITYTVSFDSNGGVGTTVSTLCTYDNSCGLTSSGFSKAGYFFTGWATTSSGSVVYTDAQSVSNLSATNSSTVTLYAKYTTPITYTIAFDINGGTGGTTASKACTYDAACTLTANGFVKAGSGYLFTGWATSAGGSVVYTDGQSVTNLTTTNGATVTLYAKYLTPITYTIAFDINGGTGGTTASKACTYDTACTLTTNGFVKTGSGYLFSGWATSAGGSVVYTDAQSVTNLTTTNGATVTLYAKYTTPITYTIAFDINTGTSGTTASKACTYDTACTLTTNGFAKTGYTFAGWATSSGGAVVYTNGASVTNLTTTNGATVTLYAKWTANTYTIAFNASGGTGTVSSIVCTYNVACTLPSNTFTRTGYIAASGWATTSGGAVVYSNGTTVSNLSATNGATVTLYAGTWTAITYTIAFDINTGTSGTTASKACTYGVACVLTSNGFAKTGYTFAGWATSSSGAVAYTNGASVTNLSSTNGATVTLYAKWTAITYTVAFDINGGTGGTTASKACTYDAACTLTANGFTKTNYTFANWNTVAGGTGTSYNNSASVTNLTATSGATVTLYAQWTANTYNVTYSAGTGTGAPATQTYYGNDSLVLTSTQPTLTGYLFKCWATSTPSITCAYNSGDTVSSTSLTLYAIYAQETFVVNVNTGSAFQCQGGATNQYDFYNYLGSVNATTGAWTLTGHLTSTLSNARGKTYYRCFNFVANQYGALYGCERAGTSSTDYCSCPGWVTGYSTSYKSTPSTCSSGSGGLKVTATFNYADSVPSGTVFTN